MKKLYRSEESGRSMVEMLGVLSIIGVLSIGGISGYSKAMAKFKASKAMDQLSLLIANIRTSYSTVANYDGLNNGVASLYAIASKDMYGGIAPVAASDATFSLVNAFGGELHILAITNQGVVNTGFGIQYNGLGKEACVTLATADWGTGGLAGIIVKDAKGDGLKAATTFPATGTVASGIYSIANLPVKLAQAYTSCGSPEAQNSITWYFY